RVLHRRLSLLDLDRGKARWLAEGQPAAQGGDQRDRRNRRGRLVRRFRGSGELVSREPGSNGPGSASICKLPKADIQETCPNIRFGGGQVCPRRKMFQCFGCSASSFR